MRARQRLVPPSSGRIADGASSTRESFRALARGQPVEAGEPAAGEVLARDVQRPPERLAAADGDDLRAGLERVQPLRRGGEPGADDGDRRARTRAARTRAPSRGSRAARPAPSRPGWPGATSTCRKAPWPSSSKPPSTARTRSIRSLCRLASQPLRSRSRSTCARNSSHRRVDSGRRADSTSGAGERRGPPSRGRRAPETIVGPQWPSLSERISRCRIAAAAPPERRRPGRRRCRRPRSRPARARGAGSGTP